ncbi:MAG: FimB/Mfa2 family fimbrial subunit [Prevotella sp.]|nr:FimB/Mfa2 family fimbrial subunit [Prevotella sp.]MCM1075700.1 FimB/Mfa2 family fimbrial subunit [Ruminococcus sp.]
MKTLLALHNKRASRRHKMSVVSLMMLLICAMTGCNGMGTYDDLEECPRGVVMRFVFDYNLEFANSFPHHVDCLSVYLFNENGDLVERRTETSEVLADEDWRMTFDLPAGNYQVVAYGGLECDMASFSHTKAAERVSRIEDLEVLMHEEHIGDEASRPDSRLHDLFHGIHTFTVSEGITYDKTTVHMMRDTNNIRIVLQHLDNTPVNDKDFRFEIVDDNIWFNYKNDVLPHHTVTYTPWVTGTASSGLNGIPTDYDAPKRSGAVEAHEVQVAYADLSVSRLMHQSDFKWTNEQGKTQQGPRLRIISKQNGRIVADLPLNNYLLLLKGEHLASMPAQEFLDRANNYSLVFFLDRDNAWVRMNIIVDDWTVRVNNINEF